MFLSRFGISFGAYSRVYTSIPTAVAVGKQEYASNSNPMKSRDNVIAAKTRRPASP